MRKYGVKMKDRFLAGLLALIMIIGMLPLTVTAAPEDDVQQSEQDLFVVTVTEVGEDGLEKAVGGAKLTYTLQAGTGEPVETLQKDITVETDENGQAKIDFSAYTDKISAETVTFLYTVTKEGYKQTSGQKKLETEKDSLSITLAKDEPVAPQKSTISVKVVGEGTATLTADEQNEIKVTKDTEDADNSLAVDLGKEVTLSVDGLNATVKVRKDDAEPEDVTLENNQAKITADKEKIEIEVTFAAGEEQPPEETTYTVTLDADEGGDVALAVGEQRLELTDGKATVDAGTQLILTVKPHANYRIGKVTVDEKEVTLDTASSSTITVTANTTIAVTFVKECEVSVTVTDPKDGDVKLTVGEQRLELTDGKTTVDAGTQLTLTVKPHANYRIGKVTIGGNEVTLGTASSLIITVTDNTAIAVTFVKECEVSVTVTDPEDGDVALTAGGQRLDLTDGKTTVDAGTQLTLTVTPKAGYYIESVSIGGKPQDITDAKPFPIEISDSTKIEVVFGYRVEIQVSGVSTDENESGELLVNDQKVGKYAAVKRGPNLKLKVTPAESFYLSRVQTSGGFDTGDPTIEGAKHLEPNLYTSGHPYENENISINGPCVLNIYFAKMHFAVEAEADGEDHGTVTVTDDNDNIIGDNGVEYGKNANVAITGNAGYYVAKVTVNGSEKKFVQVDNTTVSFSLENIKSDQKVKVTYKEIDKKDDAALDEIEGITVTEPLRNSDTMYVYAAGTDMTISVPDGNGIYVGTALPIGGGVADYKTQSAQIKDGEKVECIYLYSNNAWKCFKLKNPVTFAYDRIGPYAKAYKITGENDNETAVNDSNFVVKANVKVEIDFSDIKDTSAEDADSEDTNTEGTDAEKAEPVWSGIKEIQYLVNTTEGVGADEEYTKISYEADKKESKRQESIAVNMCDEKFAKAKVVYVHAKVTDWAGNVSTMEPVQLQNSFAYEQPEVNVTVDGVKGVGAQEGYYKGNPGKETGECTVKVTVKDNSATTKLDDLKEFEAKDLEEAGLTITVKMGDKPIEWKSSQPQWLSNGSDGADGDGTFSMIIEFEAPGTYALDVSYKNIADLSDDKIEMTGAHDGNLFTIDCKAPTGEIGVVNKSVWEELMTTLTFGLITNKRVNFYVKKDDDLSGVAEIVYYKDSNAERPLPGDELNKLYDAYVSPQTPEDSTGGTTTDSEEKFGLDIPTVNENEKAVIYVRIMDRSGNYTYISTTGIIYDSTDGAISFAYNNAIETEGEEKTDSGVQSFSESADMLITVDDTVNDTVDDTLISSGIQKITYEVRAGNDKDNLTNLTASGDLFEADSDLLDGEVSYEDLTLRSEKKLRVELETTPDSTPEKPEYYQYYRVTVHATDNAGRNYDNSSDILEIIPKPLFELTPIKSCQLEGRKVLKDDSGDVIEDIYFAEYSLRLTATNRNGYFDQSTADKATSINGERIYDDEGKFIEKYKDICTVSEWQTDDDERTFYKDFRFIKSGKYTFEFKGYTDKFGTANLDPITFVLDNKTPTAKVSTLNSAWQELLTTLTFGLASSEKVNVVCEAGDDYELYRIDYLRVTNISDKLFGLTAPFTQEDLKKALDKENFKAFWNSDLNAEGPTTQNVEVPLENPDRYILFFKVTDAAGHYQYFCSDGVVIDQTESKIDFVVKTPASGKQHNDQDVYTGNVTVNVAVTEQPADTFSGIQSVSWQIKDGKERSEKYTETFAESGQELELKDLKATWKKDITIDAREYNGCDVVLLVETTDNAGNTASKEQKLDIDAVEATIDVEFDNNNVINYGENGTRGYFNRQRTATVTFTERSAHFDRNAAKEAISIEAKDANGKVVEDAYTISEWTDKTDGNTQDKDTHTLTIKFIKDANYEFNIAYKDQLTGQNVRAIAADGTKAPSWFTVDTTAPTGEVTAMATTKDGRQLRPQTWYNRHDPSYNFWSNGSIDITASTGDTTSPVQKVQYYKVKSDKASGNTKAKSETELGNLSENEWKAFDKKTGLKMSNEEQFVIYLKVTDMAGNRSYVNTDGLIIDKNAPTEKFTAPVIKLDAGREDIYNGDVTVNVDVEDPLENGTYSGLQLVKYEVKSMGIVTDSGTLYSFQEGNPTQQELQQKFNAHIIVDSARNNSNDVVVKVTAVDNAGNSATKELNLKIDVSAPRIEVSYDNNAADSGDYFKADRVATVTVYERNFNEDLAKIDITNTDGTIPTHSGWRAAGGIGDEKRWVTTIAYSADGDYTFKVSCTDTAGNVNAPVEYGNSVAPTEFTIDKTLPTIRVDYDNNDARNGNYYKAERTATITITEHNFDANRANITVTATNDGAPITAPAVSGWTTNGNEHTATIHYADDARYVFKIDYIDMAGNAAAKFDDQTFYVDTIKPALRITGVEKEQAYRDDVMPKVSYSDVNLDESTLEITLTGANRGVFKKDQLDGVYSDIKNGKEFTFANFPEKKEIDDVYTLSATVTDKAGNTSTLPPIHFSVNRFGSVYDLSEATSLNGTYIKQPVDVVFSEVNANELTEITITLITNSGSIVLKEDEDYKIERSGGDGKWYKYTYTIYAKNFENDDNYSVIVESKDEAGNRAKNDMDVKDAVIKFGVDSTLPNISIENLESRSTYVGTSHTVNMTIRDNLKLAKVIVMLDGKQHIEWSGDALEEVLKNGDSFSFDISGDSTSAHNLIVYAVDAAGNGEIISDTELPENAVHVERFYVTTNLWIRFYTNTPLLIGSIVAVLLIAALIVVLVVRKKKKAEK